MTTNPNAPVFPTPPEHYELKDKGQTPGLTKREAFAAMAMQGICAGPDFAGMSEETIAESAVSQADALIAALNREEG